MFYKRKWHMSIFAFANDLLKSNGKLQLCKGTARELWSFCLHAFRTHVMIDILTFWYLYEI